MTGRCMVEAELVTHDKSFNAKGERARKDVREMAWGCWEIVARLMTGPWYGQPGQMNSQQSPKASRKQHPRHQVQCIAVL